MKHRFNINIMKKKKKNLFNNKIKNLILIASGILIGAGISILIIQNKPSNFSYNKITELPKNQIINTSRGNQMGKRCINF